MTTFAERFKQLRMEHRLTQDKIAEIFFLNKSSISRYESGKQIPEPLSLQKFSDFFNVSLDYLMGVSNNRNNISTPTLSEKDKRDIAIDVSSIMTKIQSGEDGPLYYNGEEMDSEDLELFKDALEFALKRIKVENKEKYTPKKYRK